MNSILFVAAGGFFGAISRFSLSKWLNRLYPKTKFPLGTLMANLTGSFLLGILLSLGIDGNMFALLGTGFFGALTTFSTIFVEFITLFQKKEKRTFYFYFFATYFFGISFAFAGLWFGRTAF